MPQEKLYFKNSKGNKLCGILSNPTEDKTKPITILCHGFTTGKDANTYIKLEKILNKEEISTFRFDFYGHGESEGKFEDITISEAVDDVLNSIKFIKQLGYTKISLMGASFGGIASIIAASKTQDIYLLVLKSPVSNYEELFKESRKILENWKETGYRDYERWDNKKLKLKYRFFEDSKNNDGYEAAKKIAIPAIIIHGDKDESVPVEQSRKTSKIIKNCKLEIIKGADHNYTNPEDHKKMLDLITKFIIKNSK